MLRHTGTIAVVDGATRVCTKCPLRFAAPACPGCGLPPEFPHYDVRAREWMRGMRRGWDRNRLRPPTRGALGALSYVAASAGVGTALITVMAGAPLWIAGLAVAAGVASVPASRRAIESASRRGAIARVGSALLPLHVPVADEAGRPPPARGVLLSPHGSRSRRWAVEGSFGGVAASELIGDPMALEPEGGGTPALIETRGATVVVTGPLRERVVRQLRIGPQVKSTGWLEAPLDGVLEVISLHDGARVRVHAVSGETVSAVGASQANQGYRSLPAVPVLRPHRGTIWIEVDER